MAIMQATGYYDHPLVAPGEQDMACKFGLSATCLAGTVLMTNDGSGIFTYAPSRLPAQAIVSSGFALPVSLALADMDGDGDVLRSG